MPALIIRGFKLVQNDENNFLALIRGRNKLEKLRYTVRSIGSIAVRLVGSNLPDVEKFPDLQSFSVSEENLYIGCKITQTNSLHQ